jgi:uncharacterized protein (DUF2384 family)
MPKTPSDPPGKKTISEDDPRIERWAQITELAVQECGGMPQARLWLDAPKIALGRKTPLEAMTTLEGCAAVEALLFQLNQ